MRELMLLLLILGSIQSPAFGQPIGSKKGKLNLSPPGQKAQTTEDPGSATRLLYEDPRNKNSIAAESGSQKPGSVLKQTCTDNMGMIYKEGSTGYEGCLRTYNKTAPNLPGSKHPNSVGITIGR